MVPGACKVPQVALRVSGRAGAPTRVCRGRLCGRRQDGKGGHLTFPSSASLASSFRQAVIPTFLRTLCGTLRQDSLHLALLCYRKTALAKSPGCQGPPKAV